MVINRWGIDLAKRIALKIFASYVTGQVEARDVYGFRNNLEEIALAAQDRGEAHLAFFDIQAEVDNILRDIKERAGGKREEHKVEGAAAVKEGADAEEKNRLRAPPLRKTRKMRTSRKMRKKKT